MPQGETALQLGVFVERGIIKRNRCAEPGLPYLPGMVLKTLIVKRNKTVDMKTIKIPFIITLGFFVLLLSCEKIDKDLIHENADWRYIDKGGVAFMRIFDAFAANTPNLPGNTTTGPQVFIYANGQKLNHANLGYNAAWPATSVYATIPAGPTAFDI